MHRTAYNAMFESLTAAERAAFRAQFFTPGNVWKPDNPVTQATGLRGDRPVIVNKYPDVKGHSINDATTLEQWITSILVLTGKDRMSPPAGWRGGARGTDYGMGLMGMDNKSVHGSSLALFEYRQTDNRVEQKEMSGKGVGMYYWAEWMKERYVAAEEWNKTLEPVGMWDDFGAMFAEHE